LEVDEQKIISKLEELGAEMVFNGDMNSLYYSLDSPEKFLRLRKKGDKTFLTLKIKKNQHPITISEEHEIELNDFETAKKMIEHLGLKEFSRDFRKRKSFKTNLGIVEINSYETIPTFIELEADSSEKLIALVNLIGFKMKDTKSWSGKEIIDYYKNKENLL